uniref:Uncharacterized protein n=1 Tax=viral metagenome TaxID=1070528 RepID=A0A6M3J9A1_9ZZZZ
MAVGPTMRRILRIVYDSTAGALKTKIVTAAGTDAIGELQATPTEYTLLRRLKDLLTGIVLAAGTAVIGKVRLVDSDGTEITEAFGHSLYAKLVAGLAIIGKVRLVTAEGHEVTEDTGDTVKVTLQTGTNAIGKVGHNKTGIGHGVETVDAAGTDQPIVTSSTPAKVVIIQAQTDNTGAIAVGGSGVDATVATGTGVLLYAGDSITLEVDDLADVYIDATVINEGVRFTYLT